MNSPAQYDVAVVVLNWNGWRDTLACVASLCEFAPTNTQIIVCDNGSTDGSFDRLSAEWAQRFGQSGFQSLIAQPECAPLASPRIVLIQTGANLGFAGGCNVGLKFAMQGSARFFWLLNNDTEIESGAVEALVDRFSRESMLGMCGSQLVFHDDPDVVQALGGAIYDPKTGVAQHIGAHDSRSTSIDPALVESRMDYVVGASMMVTRCFLEQVGLMTEDYFLYFEEIDWAMRGRSKGFKLGYAPNSVVRHKEGASIGTNSRKTGSLLSYRYLSRNRLLFTARFFPQCLRAVKARMAYEALVFAKRREWGVVKILLGVLLQRPRALSTVR
jgi:GT2 family glycosyltransferase